MPEACADCKPVYVMGSLLIKLCPLHAQAAALSERLAELERRLDGYKNQCSILMGNEVALAKAEMQRDDLECRLQDMEIALGGLKKMVGILESENDRLRQEISESKVREDAAFEEGIEEVAEWADNYIPDMAAAIRLLKLSPPVSDKEKKEEKK